MRPTERLAALFRDLRGETTQAELAGVLRCTQSLLSKIEGGESIPSPALVRRFAKHFKRPDVIVLWKKAKKASADAAIEESVEDAP